MPKLRDNPEGPPALEMTWEDAQRLHNSLGHTLWQAKEENSGKLPTNSGVSLMWRDWPCSININC